MKLKYILLFVLFLAVTPAYASEVGGTVTTGVSTGNSVSGILLETPTANPAPGGYTSAQNVKVSLTGGAGTQSIQYTTNSGVLTCSSGTTYSTPIAVTTDTTIQAISCYPNGFASDPVNFAYVISAAATGGNSGGNSGASYGSGIPPASSNNADFNGDGKVDITDLNILSTNWGSTNATHSTGDANGDGKVGILDLNILATQWTG